jgi:uncharacterized phage-associated protein
MYDIRAVANYFIGKGIAERIEISPMKLQKLLFFVYGIYWANKKEPLFSERFEVWPYGPVISELYHLLKGYGSSSIDRFITDIELPSGEIVKPEIDKGEKELRKFLDEFWDVYKNYSAIQLSNATHSEGTPWKKSLDNGLKVIDDKEMKEYFENLVGQNQ